MTSRQPCLIAIDWGTSNFRAYLACSDRHVLDEERSGDGILAVGQGRFAGVLHARIGRWLARHGPLPVVMSGMIGSRQGWVEVPYVRCPARVTDLARSLAGLEVEGVGHIAVVPGLDCTDAEGVPDVMRGEETQVLGALAATGDQDGTFVHPGTHSKWVSVAGGAISSFATYMTGEVFAALKEHTILGRLMTTAGESARGFLRGVETARAAPGPPGLLLHRLFATRTLGLFDRLGPDELADYLSGLLIGADLAAAAPRGRSITIIGGSELVRRYGEAADILGLPWQRGPQDSVVAGQVEIARAAGLLGGR
jgi:2-dehydro-3-deoxygalactonokinase